MTTYHPSFIPSETANEYLTIIEKELVWTKFKPSPKSRLVSRWAPGGSKLSDSIMEALVGQLQDTCGVSVEGTFLNLYANGQDYCPYHKDRYGMDVFTLSLGASRDFLLKRDGTGQSATKTTLRSGDVYFMPRSIHTDHKHSIPRRKNHEGKRISVVFFTQPTS